MSKIGNYAFLLQRSFGTKNSSNMVNPFKISNLPSCSGKEQLKAVGIDTNSKQYKAAIKEMSKHPGSSVDIGI